MNNAIDDFVLEFEEEFHSLLRIPDFSKRKKFSKYFRHDKESPTHTLSDWDLLCWLDLEAISRNEMRRIDGFIRASKGLSDVGLFSRPTLKIENGLQYMGYTPKQSFAPFLDLHLRGPIDADLWSAIYTGKEEEHQIWAMLTGWRKVKKGDTDTKYGARTTYKGHINRYWPDLEDEFIKDPEAFFRERFPNRDIPQHLLE
jgi:hypothetical protein